MLSISVIPNIDETPWRDLADERQTIIRLDGGEIQIAGMPDEYGADKSGIAIRLNLADGRTVIAQTTLQLFLTAARALEGRYPAEALSPRMSDEQMSRIDGLVAQHLSAGLMFVGQRCEVCGEPATLALGGFAHGVELPVRYRCAEHHIDAEIDS